MAHRRTKFTVVPDEWSHHYQEGLENEKEGRYTTAIQEYSAAIDIKPKNGQAFYRRALVYHAVEEFEKAMNDLNSAIRLDPADLDLRRARKAVFSEISAEQNVPIVLRNDDLDGIFLWTDRIFDDPIVRHGTARYYSDEYFSLVKGLRIQESVPEAADCFYFHGYHPRITDCWWEIFPEPEHVGELDFDNGNSRSRSAKWPKSYWENFESVHSAHREGQELKEEGTLNMNYNENIQHDAEKCEKTAVDITEANPNMEPMLPLIEETKAPTTTAQTKLGRKTLEILCLGCGGRAFHITATGLQQIKTVTFVCPDCGEYTAVTERKGGGVLVAVDRYAKAEV